MLADVAPISPEWSLMKTHTLSPQLLVWLALISQTNVSHVTLIPPLPPLASLHPDHTLPPTGALGRGKRFTYLKNGANYINGLHVHLV